MIFINFIICNSPKGARGIPGKSELIMLSLPFCFYFMKLDIFFFIERKDRNYFLSGKIIFSSNLFTFKFGVPYFNTRGEEKGRKNINLLLKIRKKVDN